MERWLKRHFGQELAFICERVTALVSKVFDLWFSLEGSLSESDCAEEIEIICPSHINKNSLFVRTMSSTSQNQSFFVISVAIALLAFVLGVYRMTAVKSENDGIVQASRNGLTKHPAEEIAPQLPTQTQSLSHSVLPPLQMGEQPVVPTLLDLQNNPEVKKKLEDNLRRNVEDSYGPFFRGLDPSLQGKINDLMVKHVLGLGDLFVPGSQAPAPDALIKRDRAHEEDLKNALGEDGYASLTDYRKTMPSRRDLSQLETRATEMGVPLTQEQKKAVFEILNAERSSVLTQYSPDRVREMIDSNVQGGQSSGAFTPDPSKVMEAFARDQASADQRALSRAEELLSEAQSDLLLEVLRSRLHQSSPVPPLLPPVPGK